jgi:ubiquinone/menaquinone biosynthesis C-methylase UbiE
MARQTIAALAAVGLLAAGATAAWLIRERGRPSACPYGQRFVLDLPRPLLRRETLRAMLGPAPGERVLEVGPGTGYYTLDVARALQPDGRLDVLDLQQPMLDELMRRVDACGIRNIVPVQGDARWLPYANATFDAAFLVATLGEVPDRTEALRELRRVLKPGGRLVVGEGQPDPHMVPLADLRAMATTADLRFERHGGGHLGYLARFRAAEHAG